MNYKSQPKTHQVVDECGEEGDDETVEHEGEHDDQEADQTGERQQ